MSESPLAFASTMLCENKTARQLFEAVKANPNRARFGFGRKLALVNIDFQQAYTRPDLFPKTAYVTQADRLDQCYRRGSARARHAGDLEPGRLQAGWR